MIADNIVNKFGGLRAMAEEGSVPLQQRIHSQTRPEIIFGKVAPGERISENRLTEKFQCSRGPSPAPGWLCRSPVRAVALVSDKDGSA